MGFEPRKVGKENARGTRHELKVGGAAIHFEKDCQ